MLLLLIVISSVASSRSTLPTCQAQTKHDTTAKAPRRPRVKDTVGVVDGVVIRYGEFKAHLNNLITERAKANRLNDSEYSLCVNDTWDDLTSAVFFREEAHTRHIHFSDRQIRDSLTINPPKSIVRLFSDSVFDRERFRIVVDDTTSAIGKQFVLLARTLYEDQAVRRAVTRSAKTDREAKNVFTAWLRKRLANSKFEDRRVAFGFY